MAWQVETDESNYWQPALFPKQWELMAACAPGPKNLVLANGPRWSGKTISALHSVLQHAWNTDKANIVIITLTQSVGVDSGVWPLLTEEIIPQWIGGNFGFDWVKPPYVHGVTKKPACIVTNKFGGKVKIQLDSLRNEDEVEDRYKGKNYSMIFVNELSKFKKRKTFDTLKQALRVYGLPEDQYLFLSDTNPSEEGPSSWIYYLWYEFRLMGDDQLKDRYPEVAPAILAKLRDSLQLLEFTIDDNLSLDAAKKQSLLADFSHDQDLLQRYGYGKWVTASSEAIFYEVFRENFHVVGEPETPGNPNPEMLVPQDDCFELATGWDLGSSNSAVSFIETALWQDEDGRTMQIFKEIDEVVRIGDHFLEDLIEAVLDRMDYWEKRIGRPILWTHYSDRNVFSVKDLDGRTYLNQRVYDLSNRRIELIGAYDAQRGSNVERRIDFFRRLLFEGRYFVSKTRCPWAIEMLKGLRRKHGRTSGIATGLVHKHKFDSTTYAICSLAYTEMNETIIFGDKKREKTESSLVQIPW